MLGASTVIVISDLHLAAERDVGLFRSDKALAELLDWILHDARPPVTLIIAGDFLDFLTSDPSQQPFQPFHPAFAKAYAASILEHHPEVFEALARIVRSPDHELVIMGGNHDPELAIPEVQWLIERRLQRSDRSVPLRWLVHGEAARIQVGDVAGLIEHGDMFDDWNRIDYAALREALSLASRGLASEHRYQPPPGTKLVIDYVALLRKQYEWVDFLKPEREAVLPILYEFLPVSVKLKVDAYLPKLISYLQRSAVSEALRRLNRARLIRAAEEASPQRRAFEAWVRSRGSDRTRGRDDNRKQLIEKLRAVSAEDDFFNIEAWDRSAGDVTHFVSRDHAIVVHGHTHAAKAYPLSSGLYMNSGTWGQLLPLPSSRAADAEWSEWLTSLENNRTSGVARPTFVVISREGAGGSVTASLMKWLAAGPETMAAWTREERANGWVQLSLAT